MLGLGSLLWVLGIAGAVVVAERSGLPWWRVMPLGLVERGMAVTEVAALVALGFWAARREAVRRAVPDQASPRSPVR
nr:hypothetical protein GCM10020093_039530 [Planobispora longispora]